jgi:uncharacterized protein
MPPPQYYQNSPRHLIAVWLMMVLLYVGCTVWGRLWQRRLAHGEWLDRCDEPRAAWTGQPEFLAALLCVLYFSLSVTAKFVWEASSSPTAITHAGLYNVIILSGGLTLVLLALLLSNGRCAARSFGLKGRPFARSLLDGLFGFRLAILPMAVAIVVMAPFRTRETQNPLLTLMADNLEPVTISLVIFIAVLIAPLSEELMFRVILQGWLRTMLPARWAVPLVAVGFSAIHGAVDGLALIPLALVLGWVYEQRHNYFTVVVIHGLFNATMLALSLLTVG